MNQSLPPLTQSAPGYLIVNYSDPHKQVALQNLVHELLTKKCIVEMGQSEKGFFSRVFLVPKPNPNEFLLVIDLSCLNEKLAPVTFRMDTLRHIKQSLKPGMWATSLDFSDAYHHIPIKKEHQVFLCFQVGQKRYKYLVLPFGLSVGPWVFTEVVKQIKLWTVSQNLSLFQYLDDLINISLSKVLLSQSTQVLVTKCIQLGLKINLSKSELVPTQSIVFLGELLNLVQGIAYTTRERSEKIQSSISMALRLHFVPLTHAESLLGLLVATYPTVPLGRLYLRSLQWQVIQKIRLGRASNSVLNLSQQTMAHLLWWMNPQNLSKGVPFLPLSPTLTVFTDASMEGWGIVFQDRVLTGKWNKYSRHINYLELKTVLLAIQLLQFSLKNKTVLFLIDNSTAVSYIARQGGIPSGPRNTETTPLGHGVIHGPNSEPAPPLFEATHLKTKGFSESVITRIQNSHAFSTRKGYKSKWVSFVAWCANREPPTNPLNPSLVLLTDYMEYLFRVKKLRPNTISNCKSAIAYYWRRTTAYLVDSTD